MGAVRAERDRVDGPEVPGERVCQRMSGFRIPESYRAVEAGGREPVPVWAEGDALGHVGVTAKGFEELLARVDVPDAHGVVGAGGRQTVPVGAVRQAVEYPGVDSPILKWLPDHLAGVDIPDGDRRRRCRRRQHGVRRG